MPGLSETVAGLARIRKSRKPSTPGSGDGGLSEVAGFGFNPGELRMLAYLPDGLAANAALVVVLHGCTQRAGGYARTAGWLALAERLGFAVLAPEQAGDNNANRCFNWFEPGDVARGSGEAASIHAVVQHMVQAHRLDADRVFVTGLSAGGAMTAALLASYPEAFAGGAVVAGLPFGVARNLQEALGAMHGGTTLTGKSLAARVLQAAPAPPRRPRLSIWHGRSDHVVASSNAAALAGQWAAVHGLAAQADELLTRPGWTRSIWRGADGGAQVELNLLDGAGHGTPLAASGEDPIGEAAPFMLETGVSSSLEIARFWGLAPPDATEWTSQGAASEPPAGPTEGLGASVMAAVAPHVSQDVQNVIAKALGAAGLLR